MSKVPFSTLDLCAKFYSTRYGIWCFKVSPESAEHTKWTDILLSFAPDELVIV